MSLKRQGIFFRDQRGDWKYRSITKGGVNFAPSFMTGEGRAYKDDLFLEELSKIQGFILGDITEFPNIPLFQVLSSDVRGWCKDSSLTEGKMNRSLCEKMFLSSK